MLLLTGPAGVGKTATIKVLAKVCNLQLHEWVNPHQSQYVEQRTQYSTPGKVYQMYENHTSDINSMRERIPDI